MVYLQNSFEDKKAAQRKRYGVKLLPNKTPCDEITVDVLLKDVQWVESTRVWQTRVLPSALRGGACRHTHFVTVPSLSSNHLFLNVPHDVFAY